VRELIVAPVRQHSRKPDEIYRRVEALCDGSCLEVAGLDLHRRRSRKVSA